MLRPSIIFPGLRSEPKAMEIDEKEKMKRIKRMIRVTQLNNLPRKFPTLIHPLYYKYINEILHRSFQPHF